MKANEFVKKFGWERAKASLKMHIADFNRSFDLPMSLLIDIRNDLKRLVESYDFINEHGGVERCKEWYKTSPFKRDKYMRGLKQAIADVGSCQ